VYATNAALASMIQIANPSNAMMIGKDRDGSSGWYGSAGEYVIAGNGNYPMDFWTNSAKRMTLTSAGGVSFGSSGTAYGTTGQILKSNGNAAPSWSNLSGVLQVVSTTKTDTFSTTSTSFTDITGLSVSITPSSASSKILIIVSLVGSVSGTSYKSVIRLMRDSTAIGNGTPVGNRSGGIGATSANTWQALAVNANFLDSPATTSSVTYKLQGLIQSGVSLLINRTGDDGDSADIVRAASTITVMEIAG
jgi:hypothetical protein